MGGRVCLGVSVWGHVPGGCLPGWGVSARVGVCPVGCMCLPEGGLARGCLPGDVHEIITGECMLVVVY